MDELLARVNDETIAIAVRGVRALEQRWMTVPPGQTLWLCWPPPPAFTAAQRAQRLTDHSGGRSAEANVSATRAIERELANLTSVHINANYAEFYKDLRASTEHAHDMVRASYMRRFPPAKLGSEAEGFFESSLNWAREDGHHLRRIVCRPDEDALLSWVRDQDQKSKEPNSHYLINVVDWAVRDVDALSVATVDGEIVFFAFSGSEDSDAWVQHAKPGGRSLFR
jgi:hypothetical protein